MRSLINRLMLTIFLLCFAGPAMDMAFADQYSCYLQAPDQDVYVRVFSVDSFGDQQVEIWSGVIPKNQQQSNLNPDYPEKFLLSRYLHHQNFHQRTHREILHNLLTASQGSPMLTHV